MAIIAVIRVGKKDNQVIGKFEGERQSEALQLVVDAVSRSKNTRGGIFLDLEDSKPILLKRVRRNWLGKVKIT